MPRRNNADYATVKVNPHLVNRTWPEVIEFAPHYEQKASTTAVYIYFPITYVSTSLSFDCFFKERGEQFDVEKLRFTSSDDCVAYVDVIAGLHIYAKSPGKCTIKIEFEELIQLFHITVGEQPDDRMLLMTLGEVNENSGESTDFSAPTRSQMQDKGLAMKAYIWNAVKGYLIWSNKKEYMSIGLHWGLPYTQMSWHDEIEFENYRLTESETRFYREGYDSGLDRYYGYYGLDCAGFISKCWQLSTKQNTTTLANNYKPLKAGNPSVQTGDALIITGHVMFVANNNTAGSSLTIVHQTVPETQWRFPSYAEIQNEGYKPISYFFPDGENL